MSKHSETQSKFIENCMENLSRWENENVGRKTVKQTNKLGKLQNSAEILQENKIRTKIGILGKLYK